MDSSAAISIRLVARLREAGLEVVGRAAKAAAALQQVATQTPDAVVLDPHLPDQSGLDHAAGAAPLALLVVFGSDPHPRYRSHCRALGADLFYDKTTELDALAIGLAQAAALRARG